MTYFSQKEFQAFIVAEVGNINRGWLALSGRVLSQEEACKLEQLLNEFFRKTDHRSFKRHT